MTKQELKQYIHISRRIDLLEEESVVIRQRIMSATQALDIKVRGSKQHDKIGDTIVKLESHRELINELYDELMIRRKRIEYAIEQLEPQQALIIHLRYIKGLKWEQICVDMAFEWTHVHRLHSRALQALNE